jgi:Uma2 family endonuclease
MGIAVMERPKTISVAEYLAMERAAETKNEYDNGEIIPMPGASRKHNLIVANLMLNLGAQLIDRPCEVYPSEMRVRARGSRSYSYPDVSVVCGTPRFEDDYIDTLLNPTVIIEVLSASTQSYDRGRKFANYRFLNSLKDYILVDQEEFHVEQYTRQADGSWRFVEASSLAERLVIESIGCQLTLQEIYRKVEDLIQP